ncbi:isoprenylcysteine carboxylmethyltransferase family protein [Chloroflexi bacterium TSY]|nr:isoprenylcysteine carboxylmethyltransferase family protein [Chloroflexi bacterium TSY]
MKQPWWSGQRGEWYVVVQILLLALLVFGPESISWLPRWSGSLRTASQLIGAPISIIGLLLLGSGMLHLGPNLTALPHPKDDSELVTNGAYGIVRHPIYGGMILGALGWSLWKGSVLMLVYTAILFAFFDVKSRREERWLRDKFKPYAAYQQRVRKLVPFIY